MNEEQLREFMTARKRSPNVERMEVSALHCYGCAHSVGGAAPPSGPSGERPCQACIRNPGREVNAACPNIVVDDRGHARAFNALAGTQYNGVPIVHHPSDRYVTLDQRDQESWLELHPEYQGPITFDAEGNPKVVGG